MSIEQIDLIWQQHLHHYTDGILYRVAKDRRWILYRVLEYDPLLDSSNMTFDDYVHLATDISVSLV